MDLAASPELLGIARRKLELLRGYADLKKSNGLAFYKPHRKQDLFHRAGSFRYRYGRTGNRFGKSDMGAAEDCAWATGERSWYPRTDPARKAGIPNHPVRILIICNDWDKSTEIFTSQTGDIGKLFKLLPPDWIDKIHKNHSGAIDMISGKNGSSISLDTVKSFMQNPMSQESSTWDAIHVDEPCPKKMYVGAARGLMDRNGKSWFTCTPLSEPWINDMFVARRDVIDEELPTIHGDKWMITGSVYDNPYISVEAIEAFKAELTNDEIQCRIHGIPLALAGMVYKEFDYEKHVFYKPPFGWTDIANPPLDYTIRFAIDPHPQKPHAVLFAATSPFEEVYFCHEIYEKCYIEDLCNRIKDFNKRRFTADAVCDVLAWTPNPRDGSNMADDFIGHDVFVEKATKDFSRGILSVQSHLKLPDHWHFSSELTETLFEFDHYLWDGEKNKPIDKDDHMMENLYRLALGGLDYVKPPTDEDYKIIGDIEIPYADFNLDD